MSTRRALVLVPALVAALAVPADAGAQAGPAGERPEPAWSLGAGYADGYVLRGEVPAGWALYAPDPGETGLPLRVRWVGRDAASGGAEAGAVGARWPEPREEVAAYGPVRVYRGALRVELEAPDPGAPRPVALEVRWAICRDDLCVPGTTRLPVPPAPR